MRFIKQDLEKVDRMQTKNIAQNLSAITTIGLIFLMLVYFSLTIYSSTELAGHTELISSHPFEVVIAAGELKTYLSEMQIRSERLTKYNEQADILLVRMAINSLRQAMETPLYTIETQYLGSKADVQVLKETLTQLKERQDNYLAFAQSATLKEIEQYEESQLYPLFAQATEQVEKIITTAQNRKLWYEEMAESLRKGTLIGSLVLITLMIIGLLLSQYAMRRQRQELLRRSQLFDNLSLNIDDAFLICDAQTREISYTSLNISRVLGYAIKQLEDVWQGFFAEDAQKFTVVMNNPEFVSPYVNMVEYTFPNGEKRWIQVRIYRAENMKEPQIISVFSDCTEETKSRKALQAAMTSAEQANEAKSVFLSRMSHEIRTPLNAIIGMTTIAAASINNAVKISDCLEKIKFSSKHLLMLINDVLDMSKIESDKMTLQNEPFDLFQVMHNFVATIYAQAKDKGIAFSEVMEGFDGQAQYLGDSLRLNQILLNLTSNAIKFTPSGGKVFLKIQHIATKGTIDVVRFVISDTGIGMTKDALERIFKPFEQANASIAGQFGGTGLGMSITKNLVTLMNGEIEVQSTPGIGTTCIVDLPFQRDDLVEQQSDFANRKLRALIMDDEQTVCETMTALLEKLKIETEWVLTGQAAVQRIVEAQQQENGFDFCFLDWKMSDMDGIEVTRLVRANLGTDLPIIMMSAYDSSEVETIAKQAGVNTFLPKPLCRSTIYTAIQTALSQQKIVSTDNLSEENRLQGKRMLIAEDNQLNREILVELLEMLGMKAECAANGQEAVNLFLQTSPGYFDAILMDVQMPIMDGHTAARQIRASAHPAAATIPIIATTANAFSDDITAALAAGMNAHISKPIDLEQLSQLLSKFL